MSSIHIVLTPVKVTFGRHGRGFTLRVMTKRALTRRMPAACVEMRCAGGGQRFGISGLGGVVFGIFVSRQGGR